MSILIGEHVEQIHFETKELAKSTMDTLPSVPAYSMDAISVGALEDFKVEPDVIFAAVYPGMVNRIMDASLWYKVSVVAFPCMGSRRWGGMTDMDLALAVNIKQYDRFIKGLENTWLTGHSYPIAVHLGEVFETHHPVPAESYSSVYPYCYEE